MIARTELAFAYNNGAYLAIEEARQLGYTGDHKKIWLTGDDERVCPICSGVEGETVNLNAWFSIGVLLPPAHPHCRCGVAYEEITEPTVPNAA
jgi:SPP1 gp7 family putative phage head morphogenesis protein